MQSTNKALLGALIIQALASCTIGPFVAQTKSGYIASLGGSLGVKTTGESSSLKLPDGTEITHSVQTKDEAKVIGVLENTKMMNQLPNVVSRTSTLIRR